MGSSKDQGPILLVREMRGIDTVTIPIGPYNSNIFPMYSTVHFLFHFPIYLCRVLGPNSPPRPSIAGSSQLRRSYPDIEISECVDIENPRHDFSCVACLNQYSWRRGS